MLTSHFYLLAKPQLEIRSFLKRPFIWQRGYCWRAIVVLLQRCGQHLVRYPHTATTPVI
jgi:hypothetical protein